jgi:hypothetical protein
LLSPICNYVDLSSPLWVLRQEIITKLYREFLETYCEKAGCTPFNLKIALDKAGEIIGIRGIEYLIYSGPN